MAQKNNFAAIEQKIEQNALAIERQSADLNNNMNAMFDSMVVHLVAELKQSKPTSLVGSVTSQPVMIKLSNSAAVGGVSDNTLVNKSIINTTDNAADDSLMNTGSFNISSMPFLKNRSLSSSISPCTNCRSSCANNTRIVDQPKIKPVNNLSSNNQSSIANTSSG